MNNQIQFTNEELKFLSNFLDTFFDGCPEEQEEIYLTIEKKENEGIVK